MEQFFQFYYFTKEDFDPITGYILGKTRIERPVSERDLETMQNIMLEDDNVIIASYMRIKKSYEGGDLFDSTVDFKDTRY